VVNDAVRIRWSGRTLWGITAGRIRAVDVVAPERPPNHPLSWVLTPERPPSSPKRFQVKVVRTDYGDLAIVAEPAVGTAVAVDI
jgi:hypothetical protein